MDRVWVFHGSGARFASAVFTSLESAERWIAGHRLTGVLTAYRVDVGAYEDAIERGWFTPRRDDQRSPAFIGAFTSGSQPHVHFEEGRRS